MLRYLIIACIMLTPLVAVADQHERERFSISLGGFFTERDTEIRLDSSSGLGTNTDLEEAFGLDRRSRVFRLDGYFRFKGRHRMDFSVFDLSRTSTRQIDEEIQWGDDLLEISTVIDTEFDLGIYKAAYTYELRQSETGYLGITGGLYVAESAHRLVGQNIGPIDRRSLTLPLPVLGLRGEHEFADRWTFRASGEFFFLEYDNYKGSLWDLYAVADYAVRENVAIGIGVNSVRTNVRALKPDFTGRIKFSYTGALLFFKFDFG
jgi:hypothetical protein